MVVRAMFVVALLFSAASAEQLKSPSGKIVWVDDAHLQSALENGYTRVTNEEAESIVTKVADEPSKFDWSLAAIGAGIVLAGCAAWYAMRRRG